MDKITKYGRTYISQGQGENRTYEIITPEKKEKPTVLCKLYSFNNNSISALIDQYVYATHPNQFNDIFDCYEGMIEFDDIDFIEHFIKSYAIKLFPGDKLKDAISNDFKNTSNFVRRNFRENIYRNFGVFSMTSNVHNLLMWSYYTNHCGFFLEFDITKFPFKYHGPFPLNYQEKIEPISIKECGVPLAILMQTNLKYKDWQHECEWRLLIEGDEMMYSPSFKPLRKLGGHNRKFKYPISAIKTFGFGNRFFLPEEMVIVSDKLLNINIKKNKIEKSKVLDFLIANKIHTCFAQRDGLIKIAFGGMVIEKIADNKYIFDASKWFVADESHNT